MTLLLQQMTTVDSLKKSILHEPVNQAKLEHHHNKSPTGIKGLRGTRLSFRHKLPDTQHCNEIIHAHG